MICYVTPWQLRLFPKQMIFLAKTHYLRDTIVCYKFSWTTLRPLPLIKIMSQAQHSKKRVCYYYDGNCLKYLLNTYLLWFWIIAIYNFKIDFVVIALYLHHNHCYDCAVRSWSVESDNLFSKLDVKTGTVLKFKYDLCYYC